MRRAWIPLGVIVALLALALLLAAPPAGAQTTTDYDDDNDGLIDVRTPAQLNAMRYDLDGNGEPSSGNATAYGQAFPNRDTAATTRMGCPTGNPAALCTGYELRADLDLATDYPAWTPVGSFNTVFDGKGHTISGLTVSTNTGDDNGLFSILSGSGVLRNVGLINPTVTAPTGNENRAGALVGQITTGATVSTSYVRGGTIHANGNNARIGGLVGYNYSGTVRASYSTATVGATSGSNGVFGGLVGHMEDSATLIASYSFGSVSPAGTGHAAGGLVGQTEQDSSSPTITDSYWDTQASGEADGIGGQTGTTLTVTGYTTTQLRTPTGYTGIYANWNLDLDSDSTTDDDPWDFGTASQYPALKFDTDGDNTATACEFGGQERCPLPPRVQPPARGGGQPYNWRTDHPEIYTNARHNITAACEVQTTGEGDDAVTTSTITFNLAEYSRPITLALSLWDRTHFRSLQSLGINMPALQRNGQTATVEVVTDPAKTRFRLDGQYGLNLVLGYADCHTDDPEE